MSIPFNIEDFTMDFDKITDLLDFDHAYPNTLSAGIVFDVRQHIPYISQHQGEIKTPWTYLISDKTGQYIEIPYGLHEDKSDCGFKTKNEAEMHRVLFNDIVRRHPRRWFYLVLKNSDFSKGRGPMEIDRIFSSGDKAHQYIMNHVGLHGTRQEVKLSFGINDHGWLYGRRYYNGYDIIRKPLDDLDERKPRNRLVRL